MTYRLLWQEQVVKFNITLAGVFVFWHAFSMQTKKSVLVDYIGGQGPGAQKRCAEKLGYASEQAVYNWPNKFSLSLIKAVKKNMKAAGIQIPHEWGWEKRAAR